MASQVIAFSARRGPYRLLYRIDDDHPTVRSCVLITVGAQLDVDITAPTTLEFQIAVAPHPNTQVFESLSFVLNGKPVTPMEISGVHGNRIHKFEAPVGNLQVAYAATIVGQTAPARVGWCEFSARLLRYLDCRCSTDGITSRCATP